MVKTKQFWQKMQLDFNPFISANKDYWLPEWEDKLNLLSHLSSHNRILKLVIGQKGVGKTTFINKLQVNSSHINIISLYEPVDIISFLDKLKHHLKLGIDYVNVDTFINIYSQDGENKIIVIDNANHLSLDCLEILNKWIYQIEEASSNVHFILVGDESFKVRITSIFKDTESFYSIYLSSMNINEMKQYLNYIFVSSGADSYPFAEKEIIEIYNKTKGLIGLINSYSSSKLTTKHDLFGKLKNKIFLNLKTKIILSFIMLTIIYVSYSNYKVYSNIGNIYADVDNFEKKIENNLKYTLLKSKKNQEITVDVEELKKLSKSDKKQQKDSSAFIESTESNINKDPLYDFIKSQKLSNSSEINKKI